MREFLKKLIAKKEKEEAAIRAKIEKSESAQEVRELGETLKTILDELQEAKDKLAEMDDNTDAENDDQQSDTTPPQSEPQRCSFNPAMARSLGSFKMATSEQRTGNALDSMEYRQAFMRYVQTGEWNYQKRADETLITSDVGKIIPNTIMNEFIKDLKVYGNLYNRVRHLNVRGGIEFPIEEHRQYRKLRQVFPSAITLLKPVFLSPFCRRSFLCRIWKQKWHGCLQKHL